MVYALLIGHQLACQSHKLAARMCVSCECLAHASTQLTPCYTHPATTPATATAAAATAAGASIDDADEEGVTALINAAESGSVESVRFLLDQKADASHVSAQGFTALVVAAAGGHVAVAKLLVAAGADVDHMEGEGVSALMYAAAGGHKEMVEVSYVNTNMHLC
jgi:ankyrin repeat protein